MAMLDSVEFLPTSAIGFEGYEKRLEITFFNSHAYENARGQGLRALSMANINCILDAARCTIVAKLSNNEFDSYVLSESSLFVYPYKIILKTCGTTELLRSVPVILDFSAKLSLAVLSVKYSRGTFIFPTAQPPLHQNFKNEVAKLNQYFGGLASGGNAYVLGHPASPNQNWHIYYATEKPELPMVTLEMCMTGLNCQKASVFFKNSLDGQSSSAKEMTRLSGISEIIPEMEICDFSFEPCGYSMNGVFGPALSTIHVTPEDAFSYASYEAMGFDPGRWDYGDLIKRVLHCFNPSEFSVAVTVFGGYSTAGSWGERLGVDGYNCKHAMGQELPGGGILIYQSFSATPLNAIFPINVLNAKDAHESVENSGAHEVLYQFRKRNPRRLQDSTAFVYIPSRL